jgi:hypothetical protein
MPLTPRRLEPQYDRSNTQKGGEISVEKEEQKKAKKKIDLKVRDIVPKKDAKGGRMNMPDPCEGGQLRKH